MTNEEFLQLFGEIAYKLQTEKGATLQLYWSTHSRKFVAIYADKVSVSRCSHADPDQALYAIMHDEKPTCQS